MSNATIRYTSAESFGRVNLPRPLKFRTLSSSDAMQATVVIMLGKAELTSQASALSLYPSYVRFITKLNLCGSL